VIGSAVAGALGKRTGGRRQCARLGSLSSQLHLRHRQVHSLVLQRA